MLNRVQEVSKERSVVVLQESGVTKDVRGKKSHYGNL